MTIFDARTMGGEASWAGAGMLAPGGEVDSGGGWRDLAIESAKMYPEFVRELEEESGVAIDYRPCGALELARTQAEAEALEAKSRCQAAIGIVSETVTLANAASIAPVAALDGFAAARFYPGDGMVNPREIVAALRRILVTKGAAIRENEPKARVRAVNGHVDVDGEAFDAAVLAAGAWTSSIDADGPLRESFPVRGHLTGYWLKPGFLNPILRHDHTYLLQRTSGFLIAGASEEQAGFVREIEPGTAAAIAQRAHALLPALRDRQPDEVWTGFRPGIAGQEPRLGCQPGTPVWHAYGHYRNGILLTPVTARLIAGQISASSGTG